MMTNAWHVYMILTKSGKFYTGITTDLTRRFQQHQNDKGASFFRFSKPVSIVFVEHYPNRSQASKREQQIKKMNRIEKYALVESSKSSSDPESLIATF